MGSFGNSRTSLMWAIAFCAGFLTFFGPGVDALGQEAAPAMPMPEGEHDEHMNMAMLDIEVDVNDAMRVENVTGGAAPTVTAGLKRSADGGWDLSLTTENFVMAGHDAEGPHIPGQGQIALHVNGAFVAHLMGTSHHLDPLDEGVNEIALTLVTIDGRMYANAGVLAMERFSVLVLDRDPKPDAPKASLAVDVVDGMEPETYRSNQGDLAEMRWTVASPLVIHLHGYDVAAQALPHAPLIMVIEAYAAGRFEIMSHSDEGELNPLIYLEILP